MVRAVVFDVGNVLYGWQPRRLYEHLIDDDQVLDAFLRDVVTMDWHLQHDAGRDFADTSAELIAQHPEHRELIKAWGARFEETITGPIPGSLDIVRDLDAAGVPLFGITNFSHEFFPPFRAARSEIFDRFADIVVSGDERLIKPDAAIYQLAVKRFGLAVGEGLFVDDRLENVEAASTNGFVGHHFVGAEALRGELVALGLL
ncbi:MAG: HAD family hydrolase [Sphingomonadaceae bacterium]